jgi:hypothetical protein
MNTFVESVHGKTIAQFEILDLSGQVEIEIRFTDETCLHLNCRARSEVEISEFDKLGEFAREHPTAVQESFFG